MKFQEGHVVAEEGVVLYYRSVGEGPGTMPARKAPFYERGFPTSEQMLHPPIPQLQELRMTGVDRTDPALFAREYMKTVVLARQLASPDMVDQFPLEACNHANEHPDHWITIFMDSIFPSFGNWDLRPKLADLKIPLLIIQGEKEPNLEGTREWIQSAPTSRLLIVKNAGQSPFFEQPDVFFPAVETFFDGGWPTGSVGRDA